MHLRSYQQLLCNAVALGDFWHSTKMCDRLRSILGLMFVLTTPPPNRWGLNKREIFLCYCNCSYYAISGKFNKCFLSDITFLSSSHSRTSSDRYAVSRCMAAWSFSHLLTFSESHRQNMAYVTVKVRGLGWL